MEATDSISMVVETDRETNPYSLENGTLMVNSDVPGADITSGVKLYRTVPTMRVEFRYNADGLRTQKKILIGGAVTEVNDYTLHGKLITHLTKRSVGANGSESMQELHFFYDAQSRPAVVEYNGQKYRYVHNLQGDVIGIVDHQGDVVAEYKYDAWGRNIGCVTVGDIGWQNPYRYRGYISDEELKLYYLNSRYFAVEILRFVNADSLSEIYTVNFRTNIFDYCNNCPSVYYDTSGLRPMFALSTKAETKFEKQQSFLSQKSIQNKHKSNYSCVSIKKASASLPYYGKAGEPKVLPNPDGTPKQKRWYGPDGRPEHDRDYNHPGDMNFPHDHDWKDGKRERT